MRWFQLRMTMYRDKNWDWEGRQNIRLVSNLMNLKIEILFYCAEIKMEVPINDNIGIDNKQLKENKEPEGRD